MSRKTEWNNYKMDGGGGMKGVILAGPKTSGPLWGLSEAFQKGAGYFLWVNQKRSEKLGKLELHT